MNPLPEFPASRHRACDSHLWSGAGFQPAVSPISIRQRNSCSRGTTISEALQAGSPAIQQVGNLRHSKLIPRHACAIVLLALTLAGAEKSVAANDTKVPAGLTYVWWHFGQAEFEDFQIDVTIHNDVEVKPGLYFQMYQGHIGDVGFYFGLQTDEFEPGKGGQGKGLIFSRWKTRDLADTRAVSDGWAQSAGYEGDFIGIRKRYAWTNHRYRLRLSVVDEDEAGLWYGFFVLDYDTKREDYAGAIRFPKQDGKRPRIRDGGGTWTEVYSGVKDSSEIPRWHVSIDGCFADNRKMRAQSATSDYSKVPNTDIYFDEKTRSVHFLIGKDVQRQHPKGKLY